MTSILPSRPLSISPTASRSVVGTSWTHSTGRPARCRPSSRQSTMAREEWKLSEPPRRMTALPDLMQSAPASAVTLGRDSKITPITPSGVRTRSIWRPLGRSHSAVTAPTGSGSSAMMRTASTMPSMRASVSSRRSRNALEIPLTSAASMSLALAARMALRWALIAPAATESAVCFCCGVAMARALAPMRALRPISAMMSAMERSASSALIAVLLGSHQHHVVPMDHGAAVARSEQFDDGVAALADHQPRIVAVETGQAAGDFPAFGADNGDSIAALEVAFHPGDADRQQRLAGLQCPGCTGIYTQRAGNGQRPHDPALARLCAAMGGMEQGVAAAFGPRPQRMGLGAFGDDHGRAGQGCNLARLHLGGHAPARKVAGSSPG